MPGTTIEKSSHVRVSSGTSGMMCVCVCICVCAGGCAGGRVGAVPGSSIDPTRCLARFDGQ